MSNMGHYHAESDEPLSPEEMAQAKRLFSDPMLLNNSALINWIKEYISVQTCCSDGNPPRSGHSNALLVRARSSSWYGMGDGSSVHGSLVHNYGGGADGTVATTPLTDPHTGTPGTIGPNSGWPLARDSGSWRGETKTQQNPGGYEETPGVRTSDSIVTEDGLSVNAWILFNGPGIHWDNGAGQLQMWGTSPIWGVRVAGGRGILLQVEGDTEINPAPPASTLYDLGFYISDGTTTLHLDAGQGASDGGWHMVTFTVDGATGECIVYIDGGSVVSGVYTGGTVNFGAPSIGVANYGGFLGASGGNWGPGNIDEVGVWLGEVLSPGDIADLFEG